MDNSTIYGKFRELRSRLRIWNKEIFGHQNINVDSLQAELDMLQIKNDSTGLTNTEQ